MTRHVGCYIIYIYIYISRYFSFCHYFVTIFDAFSHSLRFSRYLDFHFHIPPSYIWLLPFCLCFGKLLFSVSSFVFSFSSFVYPRTTFLSVSNILQIQRMINRSLYQSKCVRHLLPSLCGPRFITGDYINILEKYDLRPMTILKYLQ